MFRFTIRDLLWLMVVVGLSIAWVGERGLAQNAARLQWDVKALTRLLEDEGWTVSNNSAAIGIYTEQSGRYVERSEPLERLAKCKTIVAAP